jgi:hypothetical protein
MDPANIPSEANSRSAGLWSRTLICGKDEEQAGYRIA